MRVIIFGSDGFIGSAVTREFKVAGYEIHDGLDISKNRVDLLSMAETTQYISDVKPDVIINCAGVVGPEADFRDNGRITKNILVAVVENKLKPKAIIISGSAGEYGEVDSLPVAENAPLRGKTPYALSKIEEENLALTIADTEDLNVLVARLFNPIGPNMKKRFLITNLHEQIEQAKNGTNKFIKISRLDAKRDYLDVRDIAKAYRLLAEKKPKYVVYNIGSGVATTNKQLLNLLLKHSGIKSRPSIIETSDQAEPIVACQADMSRFNSEFNWSADNSVESVIKEITNAR